MEEFGPGIQRTLWENGRFEHPMTPGARILEFDSCISVCLLE
jgi:hypothetical protein